MFPYLVYGRNMFDIKKDKEKKNKVYIWDAFVISNVFFFVVFFNVNMSVLVFF
jgi:hypothetical protein